MRQMLPTEYVSLKFMRSIGKKVHRSTVRLAKIMQNKMKTEMLGLVTECTRYK